MEWSHEISDLPDEENIVKCADGAAAVEADDAKCPTFYPSCTTKPESEIKELQTVQVQDNLFCCVEEPPAGTSARPDPFGLLEELGYNASMAELPPPDCVKDLSNPNSKSSFQAELNKVIDELNDDIIDLVVAPNCNQENSDSEEFLSAEDNSANFVLKADEKTLWQNRLKQDTKEIFVEIESNLKSKLFLARKIGNETETVLDAEDVEKCHIKKLPQEILLNIFSYFKPQDLCLHVAPVCRAWHSLAYDPFLWRCLKLDSNGSISSVDLCWIIKKTPGLQILVLHGRSTLNFAEVAVFTEYCKNLVHLDIGFCDGVTWPVLECVATNCSNLESLNVEGCSLVDHDCVVLLTRAPKLCQFNFSHCALVDESLIVLADRMKKIVSLNIDGISWIHDESVVHLVERHADFLEELELDGAELSDVSMLAVSECHKLKVLSLSFCEMLSDISLLYLQKLKNLVKLRLRKGTEFTVDALCSVFQNDSLSQLHVLDLSECLRVVDKCVHSFAACCGKNLLSLALCWCWNITEVGLSYIVDHCSKLHRLDLLGIDKITGECLDRVPDEMLHLQFLDLRQCNMIKDKLICDVIRRKPDLRVVNYYGEEFVYMDESGDKFCQNIQ